MRIVFSFLVLSLIVLAICWSRLPPSEPSKKLSRKNYQRVVALAPSMSDTMRALNQTHRLAGVTTHCAGEDVAHVPKIGSFAEPNFEAIVAQRPDLVVAVPHVMAKKVLGRLQENNIEIFAHQPDSLEDIKYIVTQLAEIFLVSDQGIKINQKIDGAIATARHRLNQIKISDRPITALVAVSSAPLVVSGKNTFPSDIVLGLGFNNLAETSNLPWPVWPLESLAESRPQMLILTNPELLPGFEKIFDALGLTHRDVRIIVPEWPIFESPSPAIIDDIAHLTNLLSSII